MRASLLQATTLQSLRSNKSEVRLTRPLFSLLSFRLRSFHFLSLSFIGLIACSSPCEPELPAASGGTAEERTILDELFRFWQGTAKPEALCIHSIKVVERPSGGDHDIAGGYTPALRRVEIKGGFDERIAETVPHEACHGADEALQLTERYDGGFEVPEPYLATDELSTTVEGLAYFCSRGAESISLLNLAAEACELEQDLWRSEIMLSEVYEQSERIVVRNVFTIGEAKHHILEDRVFAARVYSWSHQIITLPYHDAEGGFGTIGVNLATNEVGHGIVINPENGSTAVAGDLESTYSLPTQWSSNTVIQGWREEELHMVKTELSSGEQVYIGVSIDENEFAVIPGTCSRINSQLLEIQGGFWLFSFDGPKVSWARLEYL